MRFLYTICLTLGLLNVLVGQNIGIVYDNKDLVIKHDAQLDLNYLTVQIFNELEEQPGFAYYPDGNSREFEGMKFNIKEGWVDVNIKGNRLMLLPGTVSGVSMISKGTVDHLFIKVNLDNSVFMEVLSVGRLDLLIHRFIPEEKKDPNTSPINTVRFTDGTPDEDAVVIQEELYVWAVDGVLKLKQSKKGVFGLMSDKAENVERFVKDNQLVLKDLEDLTVIFNYYNSL